MFRKPGYNPLHGDIFCHGFRGLQFGLPAAYYVPDRPFRYKSPQRPVVFHGPKGKRARRKPQGNMELVARMDSPKILTNGCVSFLRLEPDVSHNIYIYIYGTGLPGPPPQWSWVRQVTPPCGCGPAVGLWWFRVGLELV